MPFNTLNIIEPILRSLHEEGYRTPTPIQEQAIPIVLQGKDLLGVAQTGTGKTAAFAVPIIQLLHEHKAHDKKRNIRALILTPTRELAVQIDESFKAYGRHTRLSSIVIFGGVNQNKQTSALYRGVDIVVATPGRLLDLMEQGHVELRHVEIFVLDEADRMLDMGFVRDVQKILAALPQKRQSLFFSATMPPAIVTLAHDILHHPVRVEVTPPAATVDLIEQSLYYVEKGNKPALLMQLLEDKRIETALVFTRTKRGADVVARTLERNHISAEAIHGNKAQNARQRALTNFKARKTRVLVATDIAARGIDVDDLEYVINYEIPNVPETYVHRIGRTGRAGAAGTAISFCSPDEKPFIRDIEKLIRKRIPVAHDHTFAKTPMENTNSPSSSRRRGAGGGVLPKSGTPARHETPPRNIGNETRSGPQLKLTKKNSPQHSEARAEHGRPQHAKPHSQNSKPKSSGSQNKKAEHGRRRRRPARG
jgi:ATP-dependent RNA helicase RhlE